MEFLSLVCGPLFVSHPTLTCLVLVPAIPGSSVPMVTPGMGAGKCLCLAIVPGYSFV